MEGQCRGKWWGNGVAIEEGKKGNGWGNGGTMQGGIEGKWSGNGRGKEGEKRGKAGTMQGGGMEGAPISCSSNEYFMFGDM